jgi:hypothetical protein
MAISEMPIDESVYVQMSHRDLWKPNYSDSGYTISVKTLEVHELITQLSLNLATGPPYLSPTTLFFFKISSISCNSSSVNRTSLVFSSTLASVLGHSGGVLGLGERAGAISTLTIPWMGSEAALLHQLPSLCA